MTTQSDSKNPVASPRKGHKTGVVCELSVFLKVKPGHEKQIREVFTSIAATDTADQGALSHKVLESVGTLHESRQVLFDNDTRLLIATSFDGDWDVYIEDFARTPTCCPPGGKPSGSGMASAIRRSKEAAFPAPTPRSAL